MKVDVTTALSVLRKCKCNNNLNTKCWQLTWTEVWCNLRCVNINWLEPITRGGGRKECRKWDVKQAGCLHGWVGGSAGSRKRSSEREKSCNHIPGKWRNNHPEVSCYITGVMLNYPQRQSLLSLFLSHHYLSLVIHPSVHPGNTNSVFALDYISGSLTVNGQLDRENPLYSAGFTLTVKVSCWIWDSCFTSVSRGCY